MISLQALQDRYRRDAGAVGVHARIRQGRRAVAVVGITVGSWRSR